ncbi:MAG: 3-hydroxyacyl-CoA dehydrogenase [Actinobacteria bacterium]|nr:3-hydroxyacyl-CoA dehydrogenase [Actinomycetota bacterium]
MNGEPALMPPGSGVELPDAPIGVVGAGTMGQGIAQVAAGGGMHVRLFDVADGAAERAVNRIGDLLKRAVDRGRSTQQSASETLRRLEPVHDLEELADCFMVIEAAPEDLAIKQDLFRDLAALCGPDTIIATNTSSIPVTAVASGIDNPERVVGMHFFNPVPLMKLVEVIAGMNSGARALAATREVARRMGREPIDAADGPGFLVNRCSRPFLLEAQRLMQERVADHHLIDRIARLGGGFRMGPFELSDLVGIDVGYDIARSFYELSHNEPRWQPTGIPPRLIAAGRLGRKSRRGYYTYDAEGRYRDEDPSARLPESASGQVEIIGQTTLADQLRRLAEGTGYTVVGREDGTSGPRALVIDARIANAGTGIHNPAGPVAVLCAGNSLAEASAGKDYAGFHCLPPMGETRLVELTRGTATSEFTAGATAHFFHAIGMHVVWVGDTPGLVLGACTSSGSATPPASCWAGSSAS